MSARYKIQQLLGECCLVFHDAEGKRRRHRLGTSDEGEAERLAPALYAELTKPSSSAWAELWRAYDYDKAGRAVLTRRVYSWKALEARFAKMPAEETTVEDCRAHMAERRKAGIKEHTLHTELNHLRTTGNWAAKRGLLPKAPYIELPPKPGPREGYLTKEQCKKVIAAAKRPHAKLALILLLGTGARSAALLGLTWDRCDFKRELIDLRDPTLTRRHKGRAIVPMNKTVRAALIEAQKKSKSPFVIAWRGERVKSLKRALKTAGEAAGVGAVGTHLCRHSAAVHMAEDRVPMEEIQQYMGHDDIETTRKIYARFSPDYLKGAAASLEYDL